jgi:hypothetical protein
MVSRRFRQAENRPFSRISALASRGIVHGRCRVMVYLFTRSVSITPRRMVRIQQYGVPEGNGAAW